MSTKRRTDLTVAQKREIYAYKEVNQKFTQDTIAKHPLLHKWEVKIARRTVGNILERRSERTAIECHNTKAKRAKKPRFAVLEEALVMWFTTMQAKKAIITNSILIEKGKQYAEKLNCEHFSPSGGWLSRFKSRLSISLRNLHGEAASVDVSGVATAQMTLREVLSEYSPANTYVQYRRDRAFLQNATK